MKNWGMIIEWNLRKRNLKQDNSLKNHLIHVSTTENCSGQGLELEATGLMCWCSNHLSCRGLRWQPYHLVNVSRSASGFSQKHIALDDCLSPRITTKSYLWPSLHVWSLMWGWLCGAPWPLNILNSGQVLACLGEYEEAVKTLKDALTREPSSKVSLPPILQLFSTRSNCYLTQGGCVFW